ncbi:hypothetical protein [Salidesulfovibrio brasiliensis]|uniref:hypothetical protein n=1 Tax=Salidesulfovibrio brasiliensis TaxID=221711 RepID=UPI0006D0FCC0|nr:hypothetical protein [Salidesulfovibrio brasiliensis]
MKSIPALSRFFLVVALIAVGLFAAPAAQAEPRDVELEKFGEDLDPAVDAGLAHLFEMLNDPGLALDPARLNPLADYVIACDDDPRAFEPEERTGQGIIYKTELKQPIEKVIRYLYDPEIPNYVMVPSVLRISGWYPDSEIFKAERGVWQELDREDPYIVRGREFEECTPDSFAGAYYRYDLNRMIVVYPYKGRKLVFSVSEQPEESKAGHKGAIIDDAKWRYFYSGIQGIDKGLFSWMDTYMYGSSSVQAFVDLPDGGTRNMLFKWLSAGWGGMNVVLRTHIYEGSMRFSEAFKEVLESEALPDSEQIAGYVRDIRAMPEEAVNAKIAEYATAFEKASAENEAMDGGDFADIIKDGGYAEVLDREDRVGILVLERLRCALGLDALVDMCEPEATPAVANTPAEPDAVQPEAAADEPVDASEPVAKSETVEPVTGS